METIQVKINISSPVGRRLLKEIEKHPDVVKIERQIPESIVEKKTYTLEESFNECCDILSKNYGVDDVREL